MKKDAGQKDQVETVAVEKKLGVIASILDIITNKGPINITDIHSELVKMFPDRPADGMRKTCSAQVGGKRRPLRLEKEKGVTFSINDKGEFSIATPKKDPDPEPKKETKPDKPVKIDKKAKK